MNILTAKNLEIAIHSPTRETNHSSTTKDQIIIISKTKYKSVVIKAGLADHHAQAICFCVNTNPSYNYMRKTTHMGRTFSNTAVQTFQNYLQQESWEIVYSTENISDKFQTFMNIFKYYFDLAFPLKAKTTQATTTNKWITSDIRKSCARKRYLHNIEAKKQDNYKYIEDASNRTKEIWQVVKKETKSYKSRVNNIVLKAGLENINKPQEVANMFNNYFVNVTEKLLQQTSNRKQHTETGKKVSSVSMFLYPTNVEEIQVTIKSLKMKHSAGVDDIPDFIIKKCGDLITEPLTHLHNLSFATGTFPSCLKIAKVKPLYRKGNKDDVSNYRPLGLLSVFSKILYRLFNKRLTDFLEVNGILSEFQHGFRASRSTGNSEETHVKNIKETTDRLTRYFDDNDLIINIEKTVAMDIHTAQTKNLISPSLELYGQKIAKTACTKFLGLHLQDNLKWKAHIEQMNKKLSTSCFVLRTLKIIPATTTFSVNIMQLYTLSSGMGLCSGEILEMP
ncbi:uncharacterized protein LOC126109549 [Schistocerca cancellata]|uniref:uncharacterized protein LOC126109549 n=1 Tax=Schistocerca cancellata TaxID=274614 RepID=UPI002118798F|nr:uncharacterized protein LOC126109549 [Schistocerca cancellata]